MNRPSHAWHQQGAVSIWRYVNNVRNYPGWHLTADSDGAGSVATLIGALHSDIPGSSRSVVVHAPSPAELRVPNNRSSDIVVPSKFRLVSHSEPAHWHFEEESGTLVLNFGMSWVDPLRSAVAGIPLGKGDFSIGPAVPGQGLWVWWQPAI
jgi:hypothetical protein